MSRHYIIKTDTELLELSIIEPAGKTSEGYEYPEEKVTHVIDLSLITHLMKRNLLGEESSIFVTYKFGSSTLIQVYDYPKEKEIELCENIYTEIIQAWKHFKMFNTNMSIQ